MSEITPGDLIRSSWLDDEPTPAPEGEVTWTEDAELERRQADYERGFRDGLAASPVVPVGVSREEIARIIGRGFVGERDRMHGGGWFVVGLTGERFGDIYPDEDAAQDALANIQADAILAALRSTNTGWRDIATAPKDGTPVDLFLTYDPTNDTCKAFTGGRVPDAHYDNGWVAMSANPDGEDEYYEVEVPGIVTATHWMPSPDAPTDTGRE